MFAGTDKKPLLLIFPFGLLSHYLRCLVLCRHLKAHFELKIAWHPQFETFIEREGLDTFKCESIDAEKASRAVRTFDFSWMNEPLLEKMFKDQLSVIRMLSPVAVIGDYSLTLKMAAEAAGVPYISLLNGYMSKYYGHVRTISRTHPMYTIAKHLPGLLKDQLTRIGEANAFRQLHRPFKELRKKYDLRKRHQYMDELEGDFTLVCDLQYLFPQKELPSKYLQIAPLFFEPNFSTSENLLTLDRRKKTIYVSMGSTGEWNKLRFLDDSYFEKYNIVASGSSFTRIGKHIQHTAFINPHELLQQTDLVICHGGNGTIYQALQYEIPVLCKTSHCEQEWNVQALERSQLGESLDDVEELQSYTVIIEKWINRKGSPIFQNYSRGITKSIGDLPRALSILAEKILEKQPPSAHAVLETSF